MLKLSLLKLSFAKANVVQAKFTKVIFAKAKCAKPKFAKATCAKAKFAKAKFAEADFAKAKLAKAKLVKTKSSHAKLMILNHGTCQSGSCWDDLYNSKWCSGKSIHIFGIYRISRCRVIQGGSDPGFYTRQGS